jgi:hypothetical protein
MLQTLIEDYENMTINFNFELFIWNQSDDHPYKDIVKVMVIHPREDLTQFVYKSYTK